MNYKFELDKTSKKTICPRCNKRKLVRYIDTSTGDYLPDHFGRCDSESNCGYFLKPNKEENNQNTIYQRENKLVFEFNFSVEIIERLKVLKARFDPATKSWYIVGSLISDEVKHFAKVNDFVIIEAKPKQPIVLVPKSVLAETMETYQSNNFINGLLKLYPQKDVERVIEMYYLGSVSGDYFKGALTIPYIDEQFQIRAIQTKTFDTDLHTTNTNWVHSLKQYGGEWVEPYNLNDSKVSCLFGEHLLKQYPSKPIALVESPKTAIISTLHFGFDSFLWLSTFNKSSFKFEKVSILKGKDVRVFPDLGAFDEWQDKAQAFEVKLPNTSFVMDESIEIIATEKEREQGYDLADYILKGRVENEIEIIR